MHSLQPLILLAVSSLAVNNPHHNFFLSFPTHLCFRLQFTQHPLPNGLKSSKNNQKRFFILLVCWCFNRKPGSTYFGWKLVFFVDADNIVATINFTHHWFQCTEWFYAEEVEKSSFVCVAWFWICVLLSEVFIVFKV